MGSCLHLPEEIMEDILVRLPVKSIIRFQTVSKSWFHLTKSTRFIHKHLIRSEEPFLAMCLYVCNDFIMGASATQFHKGIIRLINIYDFQKHAADYTSSPGLDFDFPPCQSNALLKLVGHCNGILCLGYSPYILLVNPSLKQVRTLPIPPLCSPREHCELVGFGFDNVTMDFKVVRVVTSEYWGKVDGHRAQVYNLRSNAWRKLQGFPLVVHYTTKCSTSFNGDIHWCVRTELFGWRILTFNIATELFHKKTKFPQGWDNRENLGGSENVPGLFVLNQESLAFISWCSKPNSSSSYVDVWTMNNHEKEETWTKIYSIEPLTRFLKPISFSKKHKFLYETTTRKLLLYDLLNHHSSTVCNNLSQLRPHIDHSLELCLEIGECRSSLFSINTWQYGCSLADKRRDYFMGELGNYNSKYMLLMKLCFILYSCWMILVCWRFVRLN